MSENVQRVPARSVHLFEQIHKILWDKILNGEIVPSQRLKDSEWSTHLGVSRTPVREAMRKMQQEGILLPLAAGGYEVRSVSNKDLQDLYRCRAAIEALAAREVAEANNGKVVKRLDLLIKNADDAIVAKDLDRAFSLNTEFHLVLVEISGNTHLTGLYDTIRKLVIFYRSALLNRVKAGDKNEAEYVERLQTKQDEHRHILKAIASGDAARASELMESHLLETAQDMNIDA